MSKNDATKLKETWIRKLPCTAKSLQTSLGGLRDDLFSSFPIKSRHSVPELPATASTLFQSRVVELDNRARLFRPPHRTMEPSNLKWPWVRAT